MKWKKFLLALPVLVITGCSTFTNLTPLQQTRNANNLYPVEVTFRSPQQSLRWNSIQPYVLVNGQLYEMHETPMMTNRWEGYVPLSSPMDDSVTYRYKFNYEYNAFGAPQRTSAYSPAYHLQITGQ